ncbi:MAG: hypothetical protein FGM46_03140 [Ferruginibacter sp.]|nr:hypothetical protein [Ferruginibacter sp.]
MRLYSGYISIFAKGEFIRFSLTGLFCFIASVVFSQPSWTLNLFGQNEKPKQYEEKLLPSEKSANKKFTTFRRFIHNNTTHYNYYFNAKNKYNAVIERATLSQKDDYAQLLPFYPYSLENTSTQKEELDSVIYKATAGILLHDLRSDWVDDLYLLIGKSYYHRKLFDSAALTFQFINYNLFPRKKNNEEERTVGSVENASGGMSIADKEKSNFIQKIFKRPPSRNDALIWMVRNFIEQGEFSDAGGMINILQEDPNLPKRLRDDLYEVKAYWFYAQKNYDSAAVYLEKSLSNIEQKADKARAQYLLGQLYEYSGLFDKANIYYSNSSKKPTDPLQEIYANLHKAKMMHNINDPVEVKKSIENLVAMSKHDKYESYRDLIFNSAAQLSLYNKDTVSAMAFYTRTLSLDNPDIKSKNKAHFELGKLAYARADFVKSAYHYDSVDVTGLLKGADSSEFADKIISIRKVANQLSVVSHQDSIQKIAAMPASERDVFVRKLSRSLRKDATSKDEDEFTTVNIPGTDAGNNTPVDLFQTSAKGDWYFYNSSLKLRGLNEFKSKWGKRDNKDNWRRKAVMNIVVNDNINIDDPSLQNMSISGAADGKPVENSYDALMLGLPLTADQLDSSSNKIAEALVEAGKIFDYDLEEYEQSIHSYEEFIRRFPGKLPHEDVYAGLCHCYSKIGDMQKAAYYKNLIYTQMPQSAMAKKLSDTVSIRTNDLTLKATEKYKQIYNLFTEANYTQAIAEKKQADSIYGKNYWTPQLLYIESAYYAKQKQDSMAISILSELVNNYPNSPIQEKASTMIDVLKKRSEIEGYLTNLNVSRVQEEDVMLVLDNKPLLAVTVIPRVKSEIRLLKSKIQTPLLTDSVVKTPAFLKMGDFVWKPRRAHWVIMIFNKVDPLYYNQSINALNRFNRENNYDSLTISKDRFDDDNAILTFSKFEDAESAVSYHDHLKRQLVSEIPWLDRSKYSFLVISPENLEVLKKNKDFTTYKKLINSQYPSKF